MAESIQQRLNDLQQISMEDETDYNEESNDMENAEHIDQEEMNKLKN